MKLDPTAWTAERIASLDQKALQALSDNAHRYGIEGLIQRCATELESRSPAKSSRKRVEKTRRSLSTVVVGYHFVCERGRGVTNLEGGRFKSGSWVVKEENVQESLRHGAYLALHENKAERSYRQGRIVGYDLAERDMLKGGETQPQTRIGIEFLVETTNEPYDWVGDGAGEKGYKWANVAERELETERE